MDEELRDGVSGKIGTGVLTFSLWRGGRVVELILLVCYIEPMRVLLSGKDRKKLFDVIAREESYKKIARKLNVSPRTISDWAKGRFSMPLSIFESFLNWSDFDKTDFSPKSLPDFWHTKEAAKKGALLRMKLYGNFGTAEGRSRGGLASMFFHKANKTQFKTLKSIKVPGDSEKLAEFIGIMMGDGHLSNYQASITTNSETDKKHALFVKKLIKNLFNINASVKVRPLKSTIVVVASSKSLVDFLNRKGMPIGNKIQNNLKKPCWINSQEYQKAFLRGLFDTDGCVYLDTHRVNGKTYKHLGWTITSYAGQLVVDILTTLRGLGFSPTHQTTQKSVYLRRQKEVDRYFKEVGTHNQKHYNRYVRFIGRVPKWS